MLLLIGLAFFVAIVMLFSLICFFLVFYIPDRKPVGENEFLTPKGVVYDPYRERMVEWIKEARAMQHLDVSIVSEDGLTLRGKFYEYAPGAPIELMVHGYRGCAERDMCGGVQRCFALGRSALIVDQRASGTSDGHIITFGVKESRDCLRWVQFINEQFGSDQKIILTGISMGASTVLMASGKDLPENVVGVLADCGFTSAEEIIQKVIRQLKLPGFLLPLIKLGAHLFGHFRLEDASAVEAVKQCKIPVLLFHGEADDYVPCDMSKQNYEACASKKRICTSPNAGHGLSYPAAPEVYLRALKEFAVEWGI